MTATSSDRLRVAFVAGTLGQGGAEKQLVYMVRALLQAGVDVRVYALTRGELHQPALKALGVEPTWVGRHGHPLARLTSLALALRHFRPHVLQSAHFFTNLYVGLLAPMFRAVGIGAIRNDMPHEMEANPFWGKWLLTKVEALVANSHEAVRSAIQLGVGQERMHCLPNIIDLSEFDRHSQHAATLLPQNLASRTVVATVGRLVPAKRFDRFIEALAIAREQAPELLGCIVGDGPERERLQALAQEKGLVDEHLLFLGRRHDVPALLRQAQMLALTSDHEGFPNVLLEAMAARLPVVTTPAGDSARVVRDGVTGYVLPFDDVRGFANRLVELAQSPALRSTLGNEGRALVEREYSREGLAASLLSIYLRTATQSGSHRLTRVLSGS